MTIIDHGHSQDQTATRDVRGLYYRGADCKDAYAWHIRIGQSCLYDSAKRHKIFSLDLTRLRPDHALHNRSATSSTNALISFFRTFSFPSSASLPFNVSPTCKTLSSGTS